MKKRRDPLPMPEQLRSRIIALVHDAAGIPRWYAKAYELGLDPRGSASLAVGDGVAPVRGGDGAVPGYVPDAAVENRRAEAFRDICRRIADDVRTAEMALGNAREDVRKYVEPGYRQPPRDKSHAVITEVEWHETLERAARRARNRSALEGSE